MDTLYTFTIGFTKKSARSFFTKLHNAGVIRIVDVRLNNSSQLAGFAKARRLGILSQRALWYRVHSRTRIGPHEGHS